jgi:hypothetical protein
MEKSRISVAWEASFYIIFIIIIIIIIIIITMPLSLYENRLCGLVVGVLGYISGGPGSISGTTRKKK